MEQSEVKVRREPRRRWYWAALAGILPLAIVGTSVSAAAAWLPEDSTAATVQNEATPTTVATSEVKADGSVEDADIAASVPKVEISKSPEPEPVVPVYSSSGRSTTSSGTSRSTGSSSGSSGSSKSSTPSVSYTQYCANPSSPYSAGSSAKSLLTAANKERARLGLRSLGWSGSLSSAAQSWSENMAKTGNLAHSGRGQENVGYTYNSGGISVGSGLTIIHKAWMRSYGHCTNIMYPGYSVMGAGVAKTADGTAVYSTENFG